MFNVFLLSVAELFGNIQLKDYARGGMTKNLIGGLGGYLGVVYFLSRSFRQGNIMWVSGMWNGIGGILIPVCTFIFLGERMNHTYQYFGLVFIALGLAMTQRGGIAY